MGKKELEVKL